MVNKMVAIGNTTMKPNLLRQLNLCLFSGLVVLLSLLVGCSPSDAELEAVDYTPLPGDDWQQSTPADQGLDPMLVARLYHDAADLETLYSVLVVKDGFLVAEDYFNQGSLEQKALLQSVAKSVTSAMVGIALDQGCLSDVEQKLVDFFPDYADQMADPRKGQITIREMLQMRAGFPPEESDAALWEAVWSGDYLPLLVDVPLTSDPGTAFQYSNLTAHWLGVCRVSMSS